MKKNKARHIITAVALAILLPAALIMGAEEVYGFLSSSSSSLSSLIFYNEKKQETALFVEKEVENADENHKAPEDAEFEFILHLNDLAASRVEYSLYTSDGKYIYNYPDGQTTVKDNDKIENELRTDANGHFILKAGQKAKFEGLSPGDHYTVTEYTEDPFVLTYPASDDGKEGSIEGTLTKDGKTETFTNLYTEGKSGTLEIRKTISYPPNFEVPETPQFTFQVKIAGKVYADKDYIVKDTASGLKIGDGTTDEDGKLTLSGNTYAYFENVPADVDYSVKEILTDDQKEEGWRTVGDEEQAGATKKSGGTVLNFTNVQASFVISKSVTGGSSDDEFSFQVTDASGNAAYGKQLSYYLYDRNMQLVEDEPLQTDSDGTFTLKMDQKAVFIGLEAGVEYGVRETDSGNLVTTLPTNGVYIDKEVSDSIENIPFVNSTSGENVSLNVRKTVTDQTGTGKVPDERFTFRISKVLTIEAEDEGGEPEVQYEPAAHVPYDIQDASGVRTYETDDNGEFSIHAWETAEFIDLDPGYDYQVEEVVEKMPAGFEASGDESQEATISEDDTAKLEFENTYTGQSGFPFPFTGGKGIVMFVVLGLILIGAGTALLIYKRRRDAQGTA